MIKFIKSPNISLRFYLLIIALCFSISILNSPQAMAQIALDTTFSNDGMRIDTNTNTDPYPVYYQKIIELPDGSYVGGAHNGIHKVLPNGEKDESFGSGGSANFPIIEGYSYDGIPCVKSIARQRDGKIVVLTQVKYNNIINPFMCLIRYTGDGELDYSFHQSGYIVDSLSGHSTEPWAMAIDSVTNFDRDIIYICGTYGHCVNVPNGGTYCSDGFFVIAIGPDGNYESNFKEAGTWTGYVIPGHTSGQDYFTSIHVISPDNIILSGVTLANVYGYFALKINSLGEINSSFGTNGLWEVPDALFSFSRFAFTKRLGPDKLILFHSSQYDTDSTYITYMCLDTNGQSVNSFGQNGSIIHSFNMRKEIGGFAMWFPIAIDSDENIYTCLYSKPNVSSYVHILRMLPDGSRDTGFGNNGLLITEPIPNDNCLNGNIMYDAICTRNNKLVLAFLKDYNINAMNFGGGIYRYSEISGFPSFIAENEGSDIQISISDRQLKVLNNESGVHQIRLYNLQGQIIFSRSEYMNSGELSKIPLPLMPVGVYLVEVSLGQNRIVKKVQIDF